MAATILKATSHSNQVRTELSSLVRTELSNLGRTELSSRVCSSQDMARTVNSPVSADMANNLANSRKAMDSSLALAATVVMANPGPRIPTESEQATSEFFVC